MDDIDRASEAWGQPAATALTEPTGTVDRHLYAAALRVRRWWGFDAVPVDPPRLLTVLRWLAWTAVLSLTDAALTLWQVAVRPGFTDLNPITQSLIAAGWPAAIVLVKLASLAFAAAVLLRHYLRPAALLAARLALLIQLWVACHWIFYLIRYVLD